MNQPKKIYLKDYTPPSYCVHKIDLDICLFDTHATVAASMTMQRQQAGELVLFGRDLELISIVLNDKVLTPDDYVLDQESLTINNAPDVAHIKTLVKIVPQTNTALEGLYQAGTGSETMFVTQCEPEGFRKITFFADRPDVLTTYTTRIEADKKYPVLLANGNLTDKGEIDDKRHFAVWHDPTKKPSYLFACVIADLDVLTDHYTTMSGRDVLLEIYATSCDIQKCHVAMQALKDAMAWDEVHYGCAYDLDRYMIVATAQFNMGAMENKGLNIFNTACVLASPHTTTDERIFAVKSVIAHEYFHNWTGNRITCRDWFQLCLKEGLTVFRDQSFSESQRSPAVQRIKDVSTLCALQFAEDAGALAHPVRPESFVEINNFYTATVYEKGAEIVRMIASFLGKDKYRQATDEYFRRYDGQAVTIEDFLSAMAQADERVLAFLPWYKQPATPVLTGSFRADGDDVVLSFAQKTRHVAGFAAPVALPIPIDVAIFHGQTGQMLAQKMLLLSTDSAEFCFQKVGLGGVPPVVSVLRNFSAPVKLEFAYSDEDLVKLTAFECEGFNRWQALQTLVNRLLLGQSTNVALLVHTLKTTITDLLHSDPMLAACLFDIPSQKELAMAYDSDYWPLKVKQACDTLKQAIADGLKDQLTEWYLALPIEPYQDTPKANGCRLLRNVLLNLALTAKIEQAPAWAETLYQNATCMSERLGALTQMVAFDLPTVDACLIDFYQVFKDEALVIDSWFGMQAGADNRDVNFIKALMARDDYDWQAPNRVRAVLGALGSKPVQLWTDEGLELFLGSVVHLDALNPVLASRMLSVLARWYTLNDDDKAMAKAKLLAANAKVHSKNVQESLANMLAGDNH